MISIQKLFSGLYKLCSCGCGYLILIIDKQGRIRRFKNGHSNKGKKGSDSINWKGGRIKEGRYWKLWMSDYYETNNNYVLEHLYFYEQYHKLCMLSWGDVHHIESVTNNYCNNMIWNLKGMMKRDHGILHAKGNTNKLNKHKNTSDRKCFSCGSNKTYISQPRGDQKTPCPMWRHLPYDKVNWYCAKCYNAYYKRNKNKNTRSKITMRKLS